MSDQQSHTSHLDAFDGVGAVEGDWFDGTGRILLIWGILNPNGPTLYCLGIRDTDNGGRVFYRWLHMLGGATTYGPLLEGGSLTADRLIADVGTIDAYLAKSETPRVMELFPSFVLAESDDEVFWTIVKQLISNGPCVRSDWGRELTLLRTFDSDLFARAGYDVRVYLDNEKARARGEGRQLHPMARYVDAHFGSLPAVRNAPSLNLSHSPLTAELLEEWLTTIRRPGFKIAAFQTMAAMWDGAISMLSSEQANSTVPFVNVVKFISIFGFDVGKSVD